LLLLPELKLLGRGLKLRLGVGVVVVVVVCLMLNLDLDLDRGMVLGLEVGVDVEEGLLVNRERDLDLVRRGVDLVVVRSGTSEVACLLKPALCLEDDWTGLLTELLSFAPRLGLRGLSFQYLRSTKSRSLTVEKVLNPLPSSLSTVSNLFWDLNVIHLGHTAVGSDGLPLGGDKDGSISPRQGGQVRDGDGHILRLVPWR